MRLRDERLDHRSPAPEQARPGPRPVRCSWTLPRGHWTEPDSSAVCRDPRGAIARAQRLGRPGQPARAGGFIPYPGNGGAPPCATTACILIRAAAGRALITEASAVAAAGVASSRRAAAGWVVGPAWGG